MKKRTLISLGILIVLAGLFTLLEVPIASSQGVTLVAAYVSGDLPLDDPGSELWKQATAVEIPLSAQAVAKPLSLETRTKAVTARALLNDEHVSILVEWQDDTQDNSAVRVQDFRDMVALQFPLAGADPFFCMGQQGGDVNIWLWKADWQADMAAWQDVDAVYPGMYVDQYPFAGSAAGLQARPEDYAERSYLPALEAGNPLASGIHRTSVESLIAGGFGSLTSLPDDYQSVHGYGEWAAGKWRVIFGRQLSSQRAEEVSFTPGNAYSIAFAVWDGAHQERNGQKSTSQWVSIQLRSATQAGQIQAAAPPVQQPWWNSSDLVTNILIGLLVLFILAVGIIYSRLPE